MRMHVQMLSFPHIYGSPDCNLMGDIGHFLGLEETPSQHAVTSECRC